MNDLQAPPSQGGFDLSDTEGGFVTSVFIFSYMLFSPFFGYLVIECLESPCFSVALSGGVWQVCFPPSLSIIGSSCFCEAQSALAKPPTQFLRPQSSPIFIPARTELRFSHYTAAQFRSLRPRIYLRWRSCANSQLAMGVSNYPLRWSLVGIRFAVIRERTQSWQCRRRCDT